MRPDYRDTEGLPEGSRWLHLWTQTDPGSSQLWLGIQYETVGVGITAAPCLHIEPTAVMALWDQLSTLPGSRRVPEGVSIRLDTDD